jgi:phosphoribosyl 1,2-cyclic phosphate phosphodiesterase
MKITFLGTGTSHGVPQIDCMLQGYVNCAKGVCQASEHDPRHRRTRSSIIVEYNGRTVLIDVSPDFRQQALTARLMHLDAVLVTHSHADHIGGTPDIRSYTRAAPLPLYGSRECIDHIRRSYSYAFDPPEILGGGIPQLITIPVDSSFELFGRTVTPLAVEHGSLKGCLGFRINDMAYIPDVKSIPEETLAQLSNLRCLIIDALRETRPHSTHIILPESIAMARRLRPAACYFTHFCHDIHYIADAHWLDPWMSFAYDGLAVDCGDPLPTQEHDGTL